MNRRGCLIAGSLHIGSDCKKCARHRTSSTLTGFSMQAEMRRSFVPLVLVATACSAAVAQEMTTATPKPQPPVMVTGKTVVIGFKVTTDGKLYLPVTVSGRELVLFIDTGATT